MIRRYCIKDKVPPSNTNDKNDAKIDKSEALPPASPSSHSHFEFFGHRRQKLAVDLGLLHLLKNIKKYIIIKGIMTEKKISARGKNKARKKNDMSQYDSAWKKVIKELFKDFLSFFFPEIYHAIDFTKEIIFLDHELKELAPDSGLGDRIADVLVKVHLKNDTIKYIAIYIHIEVQSQPRPNLMERIFIYLYRVFDIRKDSDIPVISVAILADDNESYRPDEYSFSLFG